MKTAVRLCVICCLLSGILGQPAPASAQVTLYSHHEAVYSAADFQPANNVLRYYRKYNNLYPSEIQPGGSVFSMPLILPPDAEIESITMYYQRNATVTGVLKLELWWCNPETNVGNRLLILETSDSAPAGKAWWIRQAFTPPHVIDGQYAYQLRATFQSAQDVFLLGAKVNYRLPLFSIIPTETTLTVAGMNFLPAGSDMGYAPFDYGMYLTQMPTSTVPHFFFPLDLPVGAQIEEVRFFFIDNDASSLLVSITGLNPLSHQDTVYSSHSTSLQTPSPNIQGHTLDASAVPTHTGQLRYWLTYFPLTASHDLVLVGARVRYTSSPGRGMQAKTYAGAEFRPDTGYAGFTTEFGDLAPLNSNAYNHYATDLGLPDQVVIWHIEFYYKDNRPDSDLKTTVMRYTPSTFTNDHNEHFEWDTGDMGPPSPNIRWMGGMPDIEMPLDTANHSYQAWTAFDGNSDLTLYGMQVLYFRPYHSYLPALERE